MAKTNSTVTTLEDEVKIEGAAGESPASTTVIGDNHDDQLSGERVNITIHISELEGGHEAVPVSINGYMYQIPRGVPVSVPVEVVHILDNAVQTLYTQTPSGVIERRVPRFAFSRI